MPDRVVRQLGYVQTIPTPILVPMSHHRSWDARGYTVHLHGHVIENEWAWFPRFNILPPPLTPVPADQPWATSPDYIDWFIRVSHPRLILRGDVPAVPLRANSEYVRNVLFFKILDCLLFSTDFYWKCKFRSGCTSISHSFDGRPRSGVRGTQMTRRCEILGGY